ncbi:agmatine deiminase family protein [Phosphitispora sp. TUW77]|uniref:agmatine deiminase family protein n=1 Tax=Phosphitispora sp. TUW77 TaxID=3152361 RepID=UPI003AB3A735
MYPAEQKFKMPPEWAVHVRTFIEWPVKSSMCRPENYAEVCRGYADAARAIAGFEPVTMLVNPEDMNQASKLCGPEVELVEMLHNDSWFRDNGPTFVINDSGQIAGINWKFNAWGGRYLPCDLDDSVPLKLLEREQIPIFNAPIVLEGGSIHVDGEGSLLTTQECLLNPNRNKGMTKKEITAVLKQYLGIETVIWLNKGLAGDETDGHIDNAVCFVRPGVVLMQVCNDPNDSNYATTRENLGVLQKSADARGRSLEIIQIPQPVPEYYMDKRLTLSYINFYFVNGGIILPVFGGKSAETDKIAEQIFRDIFPERKVITIDGIPLVKEGGNVHCITQQMPLARPGWASHQSY